MAEAELSTLFVNTKEAKVLRLTLSELGDPQPATPIHVADTTAVGIVNHVIKRSKSQTMEMGYVWLLTQDTQTYFKFHYVPGL